jgi:hypothetical protein
MLRRAIGSALGLGWLAWTHATALAEPRESREPREGREVREQQRDGDAGLVRKPAQPFALTQVLYSTTELSRMNVRCRSLSEAETGSDDKASGKLHCTFFTVSVAQRAPERLATFENFSEILRDLRTQCRSSTTRTEQARRACAACAGKLSDECLYVQAMKELKRDCGGGTQPPEHDNPAVAALARAEAARDAGSARTTARFCAACADDESAPCFSRFWHEAPTPPRCTVSTTATELLLQRQGSSMAWTGTLADPCNTQIALSYDDARRTWTYRQLRLTPERCAPQQREDAARAQQPVVYTSAARYVIGELTLGCERLSFTP